MRELPLGVALVLGGGCADRTLSELPPDPTSVEIKDIPLEINRRVDILFVIDDSISMHDEQQSLGVNFDRFINVLDNLEGGLPDLHLGVATSNMGSLNQLTGACSGMGDNGVLFRGAAPITTAENYLVDVDGPTPGTRITNYSGPLTTAFAALADVGDTGCGFEQHLESMRAALGSPANGTFLRSNAHLAVIIVADEDDCSASSETLFQPNAALLRLDSFRCFEYGVECAESELRTPGARTDCHPREPSPYLHSVTEYVDFMRGLKPDPKDVIVAGIIGDREPVVVGTDVDTSGASWPTLNPSCTYHPPGQDEQSADPAVRIATFIEGFADHGQQTSICADDLSGPLHDVGQLIIDQVGNPCLVNNLRDVDPTTPALDAECSVSLVIPAGAGVVPLPQCDAAASVQPCWRLVPDVQCVDYPTGLAIEVVRTIAPPPGTRITGSCVVE